MALVRAVHTPVHAGTRVHVHMGVTEDTGTCVPLHERAGDDGAGRHTRDARCTFLLLPPRVLPEKLGQEHGSLNCHSANRTVGDRSAISATAAHASSHLHLPGSVSAPSGAHGAAPHLTAAPLSWGAPGWRLPPCHHPCPHLCLLSTPCPLRSSSFFALLALEERPGWVARIFCHGPEQLGSPQGGDFAFYKSSQKAAEMRNQAAARSQDPAPTRRDPPPVPPRRVLARRRKRVPAPFVRRGGSVRVFAEQPRLARGAASEEEEAGFVPFAVNYLRRLISTSV